MKTVKRLLACFAMFALAACTTTLPTAKAEPPVGVSFQFFYDNLSPHGAWVSYPSYGYVWIPRVSPGFRPYFSSGHWVHTFDGWMWVSHYDWGWAPFHYGSWLYDPFYGWLWVPGYHWAPAWVTWGYHSGYYGWAPLSPGIAFSYTYYPPMDYWVFVPPQYITTTGWNNTYYTAYNNRITFDNNTAISNVRSIDVVENTGTYAGHRYSAGPTVEQYERAANSKVNTLAVREDNTASRARLSGDNVRVFRPDVDATDKSTARPANVTPLETMKRSESEQINDAGTRNRTAEGSRDAERKATPERTAPEIKRERAPERTAPVQREQPKMERRQDVERQAAPKRENVQPGTKERQPEVRPKQNVEPPAPQRNTEPRQQFREKPQSPPKERIERQQPQPQAVPEKKQQMERTVPREPRYQPQPQPQRYEKDRPNPK